MPLLERGISSKAGRELGEEIASAHRRGESRFPNMPASPDQPSTCSKRRREIARNHGIEFLGIVGAGGYFFFLSLSLCFTYDLTTQFSDFSESLLPHFCNCARSCLTSRSSSRTVFCNSGK